MALVASWGVERVCSWLAEVGFQQLADDFCREGVDGEVLLDLTTEDLVKTFDMKLGERKKLMARIENLRDKDSRKDPSSSSAAESCRPLDEAPAPTGHPERALVHRTAGGREKLYLLDGRNIACEGGEHFHTPNLKKLITTVEYHREHRPEWTVVTFVYKALLDKWKLEYPHEMGHLESFTPTPTREDVDIFIIRRAVDAAKKGCHVKIVSNDHFQNYIGNVDNFQFSEDWVRKHVVKFCFSPSGDFTPSDGITTGGAELPPASEEAPVSSALQRMPRDMPKISEALPMLLTGRGAKFQSPLQIAKGVQEARCPHKRCTLRLETLPEAGQGYAIRITGLEAPACRAAQPVVRVTKMKATHCCCPTCGKPLELQNEGVVPKPRPQRKSKGVAFVAVLFGSDQEGKEMLQRFVLGALVLGHSLKATSTIFDLVLLHTSDVMDVPGAGLLEVFWKTRQVEYVEADPKLIRGSEERFKHVFTKLHCFGCDEYEKVVLLDIDLLVRDNIDELKNLTPPCAMRRGHKSLPAHVNGARSCYNNQGQQKFGMNLGVAVFKPSGAELSKMLKSIQSRDPMHETCHGPEQDFLTRWFNVQNRTWTRLDLKYNYQLHQLANSMEHVGAEAERLQLKFENVKVFHYSGKVKPWDFYFDSDEASFAQFCDQKLLPAYKAQGAVFEEKIQRAAQLWKDHCEAMWQEVLAKMKCDVCKLCGESLALEMQLEHCLVLCPKISDLRHDSFSLQDIRQPKPQDFRKVMAFVASVLERRPSGADEDAVVEEQGKDDETHEVSKGPEAPGTAPSSTTEATSTTELPQSSECKTLHLVLYPPPKKRSYDESPLGRLREEILQEVAANRVTIIVAPTGCGKSTRIPQMILDEDPAQRSILVTQPRRVAATSLARRVAAERNVQLGAEVGYKIGGCSEVNRSGHARTRLTFATTAIAMIQCLQDCSSFTHLIIDEVHIRDAHIDFLLSLVVTRVLVENDKIKIILMSAAMDSQKIAKYFENALRCTVPRPLDLEKCQEFKIRIKYIDDLPFFTQRRIVRQPDGTWVESDGLSDDLSQEVEDVASLHSDFIRSCHKERSARADLGSFLVFLPGKRELQLLRERLDEVPDLKVKCIFGGQTIEEQERVLAAQDSRKRTVILGTDVVESSVTIPDVDLVIDTCEQKRLRWNGGSKQSLLTPILVSKDEAKQRSGRTGRVRDGEVIRLITKECFAKLQAHAEPQIKHSRLEDLLLSIFELPNLGDPRDFVAKMPDAPDKSRVDQAIARLMELNAVAVAKQPGQSQPRPTFFGRFLQKMPLDPDVGCLVINGVRLHLVQDCAILAAVHQRGDPFLDAMNLTREEVKSLWQVRDACSPGRSQDREAPLPGDLMAGLGAYKAWKAYERYQTQRGSWPIQDEARWCAQHFLSLEKLHELEEMVLQIRDVLEELGYAESLPKAEKQRMLQRRHEKHLSATHVKSPPLASAAKDFRHLLGAEDREKELMLAWCIAASFTSGLVEVKTGSSTEQLKYKPKEDREPEEVSDMLRELGFGVLHSQTLLEGDVQVTFQSAAEAHQAFQMAQLLTNEMPWLNATPWGRPRQRRSERPRKCYRGSQLIIASSSHAWLPTTEDAVLVAGEVLPIMGKGGSMRYLCTKCSTVPAGIIPFILCATYPAVEVEKEADIWKIKSLIHGHEEVERYTAPPRQVAKMLEDIRNHMDTEFGRNPGDRARIVQERRSNVLSLMKLLDQRDLKPPMVSLDQQKRAAAPRARGPNFLDTEISSLFDLGTNNLNNFRLF